MFSMLITSRPPYADSHPDNVRYHVGAVTMHSFLVTGFTMKHPHGATITALFDDTIIAFDRNVDDDGSEIDSNSYEDFGKSYRCQARLHQRPARSEFYLREREGFGKRTIACHQAKHSRL
ncbi:hypothetical protein [Bradyrhizobium stylosanthis]|uniref:hypothetical protein n=1 Tax=Bradyrhizobium stylosanthis TaxID=1803665 RepID=UPI0011A9E5B9|nr:hypothetical protein [Bradyrhizobium stylosanthis]